MCTMYTAPPDGYGGLIWLTHLDVKSQSSVFDPLLLVRYTNDLPDIIMSDVLILNTVTKVFRGMKDDVNLLQDIDRAKER